MGKYRDEFVVQLAQCTDEQNKFIGLVSDVLKNFDSDALLRPLRENAIVLLKAVQEFRSNSEKNGVFEPEKKK
jgi:hypothetical protein